MSILYVIIFKVNINIRISVWYDDHSEFMSLGTHAAKF